ncbi:hypothetical protein OSTOST_05616 [Ostertagia ostertagi]
MSLCGWNSRETPRKSNASFAYLANQTNVFGCLRFTGRTPQTTKPTGPISTIAPALDDDFARNTEHTTPNPARMPSGVDSSDGRPQRNRRPPNRLQIEPMKKSYL